MRHSEHARLLARLESMPVIEQAKGIIMAQTHCGATEAFDLLRRASQRSNVPVRDLATQLVAKTAQASPGSRIRGFSRECPPPGPDGRFRTLGHDPAATVS